MTSRNMPQTISTIQITPLYYGIVLHEVIYLSISNTLSHCPVHYPSPSRIKLVLSFEEPEN